MGSPQSRRAALILAWNLILPLAPTRGSGFPVRTQATMKSRKAFYGFARRCECLVPTWRGWLLLVLFGIVMFASAVSRVHSFLAITEPVRAEVLVVEGWVPDYVMEEAKAEFERHHYGKLYVTGGPLEIGGYLSEYKTHAELGMATLFRLGLSKDVLVAVPAPLVKKDRTYVSAVALKNWLRQHAAEPTSINLVSMGVHARRSKLLFLKAFGEDSRVGIIAVEDRNHDPRYWWKSSQGVRVVVDELVAYFYAVFVFPFA